MIFDTSLFTSSKYTAEMLSAQPETLIVDIYVYYLGTAYAGAVNIVVYEGNTEVAFQVTGTGPSIRLWIPYHLHGKPLRVFITAPDLGNGIFTGMNLIVTEGRNVVINLVDVGGVLNNTISRHVNGVVTVNGAPARRNIHVIALEKAGCPIIAHGLSSATDGTYSIYWYEYAGKVSVIAFDDYGVSWQANHAYIAGDVIQPVGGIAGYVYVCTADGTSNADEPSWPTTIGQTLPIGTAQFICRGYSRPVCHGPITPNG